MTKWLVMYDVNDTGYVFTTEGELFTDPASMHDDMADVLRAGGVPFENLQVRGPYVRLVIDALPSQTRRHTAAPGS